MKKISLLLILVILLLTFAGCSDNGGIPTGMQAVRADEGFGYYMYAPEEWTVSNRGEVSHAYASRVDLSSVSYTEIPRPEGTAKEYFDASKAEFPTEPKMVIDGEACDFGHADGPAENALKFVYDYDYSGHKFRIMQILVEFEGRFGIFTFTSYNENITSQEKTQYAYYLDKVQSVIDNFKFVKKTGTSAQPLPSVDADGYYLASDKSVAGFSLYLPEEFKTNYSDGLVSASLTDGSTITVSKVRSAGMAVNDYFDKRIEDLEKTVTDYKQAEEVKLCSLGNANQAASYEYTYEYNGEVYRVYQVFGITTFNGFVFTFTAKDSNFYSHIETVKKIAERIVF